MIAPQQISAPLPLAHEGDPAWILSASMLNFLTRKIEAFSNIQAEPPLHIVKADAGFRLVLRELT